MPEPAPPPARPGLSARGGIPLRRVVPSLLTTVSLCCGLAAMNAALKENWNQALMAIAFAAIFDMLDGRAARLLNATSRFGAVLDSLADFLSFGVAPAVVVHLWLLRSAGFLGMLAVTAFVLCAALRLARFTANASVRSNKASSSRFFVGMPTPAAAGAVLIPVMLDASHWVRLKEAALSQSHPEATGALEILIPSLVVVHTLLVAGLMISRLPMYSFKSWRVRRRLVPPLLVLAGLLVAALFYDRWLTCSALAGAYLASLLLSLRDARRSRRGELSSVGRT